MIADKLAGRLPSDTSGTVVQVLLDIFKHERCPSGFTKDVLCGVLRLVDGVVADQVGGKKSPSAVNIERVYYFICLMHL